MDAASTTLINSIPYEIICEIIAKVIQATCPPAHDQNVRGTLRLVDRYWRSIVDSNPLFWTSLTIDKTVVDPDDEYIGDLKDWQSFPRNPKSVPPSDIFPAIAFALARSHPLPIDLTIILPPVSSPGFHEDHARNIGELLVPHTSRIRSIDIIGDEWMLHLGILLQFESVMPSLERFKQTVCDKIQLANIDTFNAFVGPTYVLPGLLQSPNCCSDQPAVNKWGRTIYPSLKTVEITGAPYAWSKFPAAGLTTLRLVFQPFDSALDADDIQRVLGSAAQTLETLELSHVLKVPEFHPGNVEPVILPVLRSLSLSYESPDEIAFFLPHIRAPVLKHLVLRDDLYVDEDDDFHYFTDMLFFATMEFLPVGQLETLQLLQVAFCDDLPVPYPVDLMREGTDVNLPASLQFLRSLKSLKQLSLSMAPGANLWAYLNFPAKPHCNRDWTLLSGESYPYPNLFTLEKIILGGHADDILEFLNVRLAFGRQSKPLVVELEKSVQSKLAVNEWIDIEDMIRTLAWRERYPIEARESRVKEAKILLGFARRRDAAIGAPDDDDDDVATFDD